MGAYQILTVVATILGLITTIGTTIAGWLISGERTKRAKVETQMEDIQRQMQAMQLELARDYVRSPQLESVLQQIRTEVGSMNANVSKALSEIHKLALQVEGIRVRNGGGDVGAAG